MHAINRLPPCPRCGGAQYRDYDVQTRSTGFTCLMCGSTTWSEPPMPWTREQPGPRLPKWLELNDE